MVAQNQRPNRPGRQDILEHLRTHSLVWSLVLASMITVFSIMLIPIYFAENDDMLMVLLLSGKYTGAPEPFLVFQNIFFSSVLAQLYHWIPDVEWYPLVLVFLSSLSLAVILISVMQKTSEMTLTTLILMLALVLVFMNITVDLQYTTVAGSLGAAGMCAIYLARSPGFAALGVVMICIGTMVRFEAGMFAALIISPIFIFGPHGDIFWRRAIVLGAVAFFLSIGLYLGSQSYVSERYADYLAFNSFRATVTDGGIWRLTAAQLPPGISMTDYMLLRDFFPDLGQFDAAKMDAIARELEQSTTSLVAADWLAGLALFKGSQPAAVTLALPLLFLICAMQWSARLLYASVLLVLLATLTYFEVTAVVKERIVLLALVATVTVILMSDLADPAARLVQMRTIFILAVPIFFMLLAYERIKRSSLLANVFDQQMETVEEWPGRVIVYRGHWRISGLRLFSGGTERFRDKITVAGWLSGHPANAGLFDSHASLLVQDNALFLNRLVHSDVEDPVRALQDALEENHGEVTTTRTVAKHPYAEIIVFERAE